MEPDRTFAIIAEQEGLSIQQVRADMIAAIHQAYLEGKPEFKVIFGDREPTPEEFIQAIAKDLIHPAPLQQNIPNAQGTVRDR